VGSGRYELLEFVEKLNHLVLGVDLAIDELRRRAYALRSMMDEVRNLTNLYRNKPEDNREAINALINAIMSLTGSLIDYGTNELGELKRELEERREELGAVRW